MPDDVQLEVLGTHGMVGNVLQCSTRQSRQRQVKHLSEDQPDDERVTLYYRLGRQRAHHCDLVGRINRHTELKI